MSRFNYYARKLEELTMEAVKQLKEAEENEKRTSQDLSLYPERHGFVDVKYQVEHEKRKLAHKEAEMHLREVRNNIPFELSKQLKELRSQLKADADNYFAVDPSQLQPEVVSFLESGITNFNDYQKLMRTAISDSNVTMIRMIANSANKTADGISDPTDRMKLKAVAAEANKYTTDNYLTAFDGLVSVSERCMSNTRLADHWNTDLGIGNAIKEF